MFLALSRVNDTQAFVSLREIDAIAKFNLSSNALGGSQLWIIGGTYGTWPIIDFDRNTTFPPGTTVWKGQHNAEFVGDHEYFMCVWRC